MNIFDQIKKGKTGDAKVESEPTQRKDGVGDSVNDSGGAAVKTVGLKPINFAGTAKGKSLPKSESDAKSQAPAASPSAGDGSQNAESKIPASQDGQGSDEGDNSRTRSGGTDQPGGDSVPAGSVSDSPAPAGLSPLAAFASQSAAGIKSESVAVESLDNSSSLAGHVPSEPPKRIVPEDMSEQQKSFIESLDALYSVSDDGQLFSAVVSTLMSEMAENRDLVGLMAPEDHHTMISGMRAKAGMARIVKTAAKAKRGTAKKKSSAKVDDALQMLQGLL